MADFPLALEVMLNESLGFAAGDCQTAADLASLFASLFPDKPSVQGSTGLSPSCAESEGVLRR